MSEYPNGNKLTTKKSKHKSFSHLKYHENSDIANLYISSGLYVECVDHFENTLHLFYCKSSDSSGVCPYCSDKSKQVHSRCQRDAHDPAIWGKVVLLTLEMRKFFCKSVSCSKKPLPSNPMMRYFVTYLRDTFVGKNMSCIYPPGKIRNYQDSKPND